MIVANVKITERDLKMFDFLFRFRYATSEQLSKYLDCSVAAVHVRIFKLKKADYIESIPIDINTCLYANGIAIRNNQNMNSYKRKVKINPWSLKHHLRIIDVFIHFIKNCGIDEKNIVTEREIYWKGTGLLRKVRKNQMPDLIIERGKKLVAVEVEKTMKNKDLIRDVFKNYSLYTTYYCVRYLCETKGIKDRIIKMAEEERAKYVKAYTLDEFFDGTDVIGF